MTYKSSPTQEKLLLKETCNFMLANFFIVDGAHRIVNTSHGGIKDLLRFYDGCKKLWGVPTSTFFIPWSRNWSFVYSVGPVKGRMTPTSNALRFGFHQRMLDTFDNLFCMEFVIGQNFFLARILSTTGLDFACINKINFPFALGEGETVIFSSKSTDAINDDNFGVVCIVRFHKK